MPGLIPSIFCSPCPASSLAPAAPTSQAEWRVRCGGTAAAPLPAALCALPRPEALGHLATPGLRKLPRLLHPPGKISRTPLPPSPRPRPALTHPPFPGSSTERRRLPSPPTPSPQQLAAAAARLPSSIRPAPPLETSSTRSCQPPPPPRSPHLTSPSTSGPDAACSTSGRTPPAQPLSAPHPAPRRGTTDPTSGRPGSGGGTASGERLEATFPASRPRARRTPAGTKSRRRARRRRRFLCFLITQNSLPQPTASPCLSRASPQQETENVYQRLLARKGLQCSIAEEGAGHVIISMGASFDHGENRNLHLAMEGGHSHNRIDHSIDMT